MKINRRAFIITLVSAPFSALFAQNVVNQHANNLNTSNLPTANEPNFSVLLAQNYQSGTNPAQFLVSEKYDGVRALWDGSNLRTRMGRIIAAPAWFTKGLPATSIDGELWLAHDKFDALSGAVRKLKPIDEEWRDISYLIYELPHAAGTFEMRAKRIVDIVNTAQLSYLKAVTQFRVKDEPALNARLKQVIAKGGEGLMLHRANAQYVTGRSDVLLKLKPLYDADATVIAYTFGQGKYKDKMGALVLETPQGVRFKLGTGFSDLQRENPPKIGSLITYTYRNITPSGKPRFASFLRVRDE